MEQQLDIFGALYEEYKITKPIRLIEFFAGYGSQNLALKYLGANYESWRICEWATKSIQAYNDLHHEDYTDYSMVYSYQEILDFLYNKGVSMNYNNPMTLEQIKRKGEKWCRNVFNNIIATNNLVNIQQVSAKDLNIVDTDKYDYVLTYSFPCQDLSLAGKRAGMVKGENTRSGMLWEVERILKECYSLGTLPKILLLENVTQLHSKENMPHLQAWLRELEKLGYSSYLQDMNSADYGVPQHRDRTFVVSILGDYYYEFPKKFPLKLVLADMLEDEVDEKYYLSDQMIKYISERGTGGFANADCRINLEVARPITTDPNKRAGTTNYLCNDLPSGFDLNSLCIKIPEATKKGYAEAYEGDGVYINRPHQKRGCVQKGLIQTLKTSPDDVGVVVRVGNYSPSGHNASTVVDSRGIAPTVMENHGTVTAVVENNGEPICLNSKGGRNGIEGLQPSLQDRIYSSSSSSSVAITTSFHPSYTDKEGLRIRKLTPKECGRLMAVRDSDIDKMSKNQSNASLYHLFGDSIVVDVLMNIFKKLI